MAQEEAGGIHLPPIRIIHRSDLRVSDEPGAESRFGKDKRYKPIAEGAAMEKETNYLRDYTKKTISPVQMYRPNRVRENPGTFIGQPTYRDDYKAYDLQSDTRTLRKYEYRPPSRKFEGSTSYSLEFVPHQISRFRNAKPFDQPKASDEPFASATSYRESFTKYPQLAARQPIERPRWQPNLAPMTDVTSYKSDYIRKDIDTQLSCKPRVAALQSEAPFEDSTTQRTSYIKWSMEKPSVHEKIAYKAPEGEFSFSTTHRTEYTPKPLEKLASKRPAEVNRSLGKFDAVTNYEVEFQNRPLGERTKSMKKNHDLPLSEPFDAEPTYKREFVRYEVIPRKDFRPHNVPLRTNEPFPNDTNYRDSYVSFKLPDREKHERPVWQPNGVKMESTTNYKSEFVPRDFVRTLNCKPEAKTVQSDDPTEYSTTHLDSFTPWLFVKDGHQQQVGHVGVIRQVDDAVVGNADVVQSEE